MPRFTDFKEIEKDKHYSFESKVSVFPKFSNCIIRVPIDLGRMINNKKLEVNIKIKND